MNFLNMALNNKRCLNCRRGSSRMATFWKVLESPIEMIFIPQKLRSLSIENLFERKHRWGKESLLIRLKCSGVKEISVDQGRRWNQQISICWWLVHIGSVDFHCLRCLIFLHCNISRSCSAGVQLNFSIAEKLKIMLCYR